ncbi:MAG: hypothetical protein ACJ8C4_13050 [Gemmataceae bacterium]
MKARAMEWFLGSCTLALLALLVIGAPMAFADDDGPCWNVTCDPGKVCLDGNCIPDPCANVTCPDGQTCINGDCVDITQYTYVDPRHPDNTIVLDADKNPVAPRTPRISFCFPYGDPSATPPSCGCFGFCINKERSATWTCKSKVGTIVYDGDERPSSTCFCAC